MDNLISGVIGAFLFITFSAGLAESIGALPFILIVAIVSVIVLVDLYQSCKQGLAEERAARNRG